MDSKTVQEAIKAVELDVVEWRRYLHRHPELSFKEEHTAQFIFDKLQSFGNLEVSRPTRTSVVARLKGQLPGKVLALRADIDALALTEENELDYVSENSGVMHACGHDGHAAMLLGTAKVLAKLTKQITGEILFIFQHAEEQYPGGAQELVEVGVLDGVDKIIGIHLSTGIPIGKIGIKSAELLANGDCFNVVIKGQGGHGARPEITIDPIAIGAQVINNLQHIVSRRQSALQPLVISITMFHGGTAHNIIPQYATLGGTVRCFDEQLRTRVPQLMEQIIKGVTEAHGAEYELDYQYGYSAVINDQQVTAEMEKIVIDVLDKDAIWPINSSLGSEDFADYLKKVPGCFIFVGAGNQEQGFVYPGHNPRFNFDENALKYGVTLFVHAALTS